MVQGVASALPLASVLPTLLFVGMVLAAVVGVMSLASRNDIYDEIGRGGLSMDRDEPLSEQTPAEPGPQTGGPSNEALARAERELEIRQMVEARSARIVRNGGEPLDVERELERLLALGAEDGDVGEDGAERELEVRQMIEARSARLVRKGGEPLDVDAEVARLLQPHAGASAADDADAERTPR